MEKSNDSLGKWLGQQESGTYVRYDVSGHLFDGFEHAAHVVELTPAAAQRGTGPFGNLQQLLLGQRTVSNVKVVITC